MKKSDKLIIRHILFDDIDRLLKVSFVASKEVPIWESPICLAYGSASSDLFRRLKVGEKIEIVWRPLPCGRLASIVSVGIEKDGKFINQYICPTEHGDTKLTCFQPFRES